MLGATRAWGLFLKSPETFRANSGATIPLKSSQRRGSYKPSHFAILLVFLTLKRVKRSAFQTSGLQFYNWLVEPEKFSGLSRNRPLDSDKSKCRTALIGTVQSFLWKKKTEEASFTWLLKSPSVMELNLAPNSSRNASILQSTCSALQYEG